MKKFLPRLLLLCLASVVLLAVTDWKNSQLPAPQISGSIERIETADGVTMTVDISGDVLQWRNANGGDSDHLGSSLLDVTWRNLTLKGVYHKAVSGEETFELEEVFIDGLQPELPGNPRLYISRGLGRGNGLIQFASFDKVGRPRTQLVGEIFFSPEEEGFVITLWKDITPPDQEGSGRTYTTGEILSYPAANRKEALERTRRILYSNYDTQQLGIWK